MILEILENNSGATYYIANLIKRDYPQWDRRTSQVLSLMKKLEKLDKVRRYNNSYARQLSWRIRE